MQINADAIAQKLNPHLRQVRCRHMGKANQAKARMIASRKIDALNIAPPNLPPLYRLRAGALLAVFFAAIILFNRLGHRPLGRPAASPLRAHDRQPEIPSRKPRLAHVAEFFQR